MNLNRFLVFVIALAFVWQAPAFAATYKGRSIKVKYIGTVTPKNSTKHKVITEAEGPTREGPSVDTYFQRFISGTKDPVRVPADHVPNPPGSPLPTSTGPTAVSFAGPDHRMQRVEAGVVIDGFTTQLSKEPADYDVFYGGTNQCSSGPCVFTVVNTALRIYTTGGTAVATRSMHQQFELSPDYEFDRSRDECFESAGGANCNGEFLADPQIYYDPPSGRWFISILEIETDDFTGALENETAILLAVSVNSNPNGSYRIYKIDTDDDGTDGTPTHPHCPCFPDQPLLGADANAVFLSSNEFGLESGFNGTHIYAVEKSDLINGGPTPNAVLFFPGALAEGISYSVYPAVTPPGGTYWSANGGVEFFLSALDFFDTLDNRIAIWAVTNTSQIGSNPGALILQNKIIGTQVYGAPPRNEQPDPPVVDPSLMPLRDCVNDPVCALTTLGLVPSNWNVPTPNVDSGGDRMQQVSYTGTSNNKLWGSLTTVVKTLNGPPRAGIAYFAFTPSFSGSTLNATVAKQGYVAVNNQGCHYPAIAVNASGKGVISFSVTGRAIAPSAGYAKVDDVNGAGAVKITSFASQGFDGFTGYWPLSGQNRSRWGDYSGASIDSAGDAWIIGGRSSTVRTVFANWSSRVAKIDITP